METRKDVKLIFIDFDGPINVSDVDTRHSIQDSPLDEKNLILENINESGNYYYSTDNFKDDIYINNVKLLSTTFNIIQKNHNILIIASQRCTFGYFKEEIIDKLLKITHAIKYSCNYVITFNEEEKKYLKSINNDIFSALNANSPLLPQQYEELNSLILSLTSEVIKEKELRNILFDSLDSIFGKDRNFLLKDNAERIGKSIALAYDPNSTGKSKNMFLNETLRIFPDIFSDQLIDSVMALHQLTQIVRDSNNTEVESKRMELLAFIKKKYFFN